MRHTQWYGRQASIEFSVVYVFCVKRSRIGLCVNYIHVESIDYLRRDFEHAHWDTPTDGACAVQKKTRHLRGVKLH